MDNFKILHLCIHINLPDHKDNLISNCDMHATDFREKRLKLLEHTALFIGLLYQISVNMLHAANQENNKSFDCYRKGILMQFRKIRIFCKITTDFVISS